MKIWYQVSVDFAHHKTFAHHLHAYANHVASPGTTVTVHGMDPEIGRGLPQADVLLSPASYHQAIKRLFLRNARKAEAEGYDAFLIGTYAEPALRELRSLVDIPVVSAAESTLTTAFTVAPRVAMIGLSQQTVPFNRASVTRHRFGERVSGIYTVNDVMLERTLDQQFDAPQDYIDQFLAAARIAIAEGADAIIPTEGVVATIVGVNGITEVDEVPIIDGVGVPVICAETAITLRRRLKIGPSRKRAYVRPSPEALKVLFDTL